MAFFDSQVSSFFVSVSGANETEISDYIIDMTFNNDRDLSDVTTFGSVGHRWKASLQNAEFTINLLYSEDTTYGTNTTFGFIRAMTSTATFSYYPGATTAESYKGNCWVDKMGVNSKVGDAVKASIHGKVDNGVTVA
jgi:hypothetical protein